MATTCNLTIEGLNRLDSCGNNMSGVKTMYICPKDDVTSINASKAATIDSFDDLVTLDTTSLTGKAVTCATGKGFAKIHCAEDMGELKYTAQGGIMGCRSLKATLEIYHPGFKRMALGAFAYFNNQESVLVVKLNNGEYHLLGDVDRGCKFTDGNEATSGKSNEDNNGANMNFEWNCAAPQIFDDAWTPDDTTKGLPMAGATE